MALVLRRFPYGESSLVVHALTPGRGRVAFLAKGAYRPSSGFFGVLDLFDTLRIRWTERPLAELGLLTAASLLTRRARIPSDPVRYRAGLSLLELAGLAAREVQEELPLFRWLSDGLDLLERESDPVLVLVAFDLSFLRSAGLAPALERCAACGEPPDGRATRVPFSLALGGRLCARCEREACARGRAVESLPLNALRVASSLMDTPPGMLERTRIDDPLRERLRRLVQRFLEYHLETRLRTREDRGASTSRRPR